MKKMLEIIIAIVNALLVVFVFRRLNKNITKKTSNIINVINKVEKDFSKKNKDNIAFVFDGLQDLNSIYEMLDSAGWIERGNKVNLYIIDKKNFNLFNLEKNNYNKVTCILKNELNKNCFYSKDKFEYSGSMYKDLEAKEDKFTIIYSSVERNIDNYKVEPYTSEIYGLEKEIINKKCYENFLKELNIAINKKCFFMYLNQNSGIEIEVIKNKNKDVQNISEILEFITNSKKTLAITKSMIKEFEVSHGLEELLVNIYYNTYHLNSFPSNNIKTVEFLGKKFEKSLHEFSKNIENSCGKLLYAFELNAPDEIMEKINPCGYNFGTFLIIFEDYILSFHNVSYE